MVCLERTKKYNLVDLCFQHAICDDCLRAAVKLAINDELHYPLSCGSVICVAIHDEKVERALSTGEDEDNQLLEQYRAKIEEYSVPAAARVYCASRECCTVQGRSRFINPEVLGEATAVICPDCDSITCRLCRELVVSGREHVCKADDLDAVVLAYIKTRPEEDHWLWQKCYSCRSWINKTEACNHITCRCTAQFCLVCGRKWGDGATSCRHGCPHYARPIYDEHGYNQFGYHKETGLNREGNPHDPHLDLQGDVGEQNYCDNEDDEDGEPRYDERGFDQWGFNRDGYDERGFNRWGFNRDGYDEEGYDTNGFNQEDQDRDRFFRDGFNAAGFDRSGLDRTGKDAEGFDYWGYDTAGFNRQGFDRTGKNIEGYFSDGYDAEGFDRAGMSKLNLPREWYDDEMYDPFGFDMFGYTRAGLDCDQRDKLGYDLEGFGKCLHAHFLE